MQKFIRLAGVLEWRLFSVVIALEQKYFEKRQCSDRWAMMMDNGRNQFSWPSHQWANNAALKWSESN
jgi:hypothetical protein